MEQALTALRAPLTTAIPTEHSIEWCAREIFRYVPQAEAAYAASSIELLAIIALRIGRLYEEMRLRRAFGPAAQDVRKVKANRVKAGRRRGRDVKADARGGDRQIAALAKQIRQQYPYDRAEYNCRGGGRPDCQEAGAKLQHRSRSAQRARTSVSAVFPPHWMPSLAGHPPTVL